MLSFLLPGQFLLVSVHCSIDYLTWLLFLNFSNQVLISKKIVPNIQNFQKTNNNQKIPNTVCLLLAAIDSHNPIYLNIELHLGKWFESPPPNPSELMCKFYILKRSICFWSTSLRSCLSSPQPFPAFWDTTIFA